MAKKTKAPKVSTLLADTLSPEEKGMRARDLFQRLKQQTLVRLLPAQIRNIKIPDYQREPIPAHVKRIREAILKGEVIPPIILAYSPDDNGGLSFVEFKTMIHSKGGEEQARNMVFRVVDGVQRVSAAQPVSQPLVGLVLPPMTDEEERQTFLALQKGRRVNSDHIIAVEASDPTNKIITEMNTDENSPLKGCIYFGKGTRNPEQIHATAFKQLLHRKIIETPEQLKPFGEFFKKVFFGQKTYAGGFKACADLWRRLKKGGKFDLKNAEHVAVFRKISWDDPEVRMLAATNSPANVTQLSDILYTTWEKSGFNA